MKLIKAIRLQRKLRKRQEYLCYKVCQWSPHLNEFAAVNKAVRNINKKLPKAYFFLSDVFGFAKSLRYDPTKQSGYNPSNLELIAFDLIPNPGFKI